MSSAVKRTIMVKVKTLIPCPKCGIWWIIENKWTPEFNLCMKCYLIKHKRWDAARKIIKEHYRSERADKYWLNGLGSRARVREFGTKLIKIMEQCYRDSSAIGKREQTVED